MSTQEVGYPVLRPWQEGDVDIVSIDLLQYVDEPLVRYLDQILLVQRT